MHKKQINKIRDEITWDAWNCNLKTTFTLFLSLHHRTGLNIFTVLPWVTHYCSPQIAGAPAALAGNCQLNSNTLNAPPTSSWKGYEGNTTELTQRINAESNWAKCKLFNVYNKNTFIEMNGNGKADLQMSFCLLFMLSMAKTPLILYALFLSLTLYMLYT